MPGGQQLLVAGDKGLAPRRAVARGGSPRVRAASVAAFITRCTCLRSLAQGC